MYPPTAEWLESAGTGAFAMGTVSRVRTRRYHALLMRADSPSLGRTVLVPGFDAWLECAGARYPLSRQAYADGVIVPTDAVAAREFFYRPWPTWTFTIAGGTWREELFISARSGETVLRWESNQLPTDAIFCLRPFFACRDYHALQARNEHFRMQPVQHPRLLRWDPLPGRPPICFKTNGQYRHEPYWYDRFEYENEKSRGFDHLEDLASPGVISWPVGDGHPRPTLIFESPDKGAADTAAVGDVTAYAASLAKSESARRAAMTPLEYSASQYLVRRDGSASIIAGYPWFTDWGRDTFVALRGLYTSQGMLDDAKAIVETWIGALDGGLVPNCHCDDGHANYAAADASLWLIVAAAELCNAMRKAKRGDRVFDTLVRGATDAILNQYLRGTNYGIRADDDGLLMAGKPGVALTWMDARIHETPVTPRSGKPVELQCLWVNALETARRRSPEFNDVLKAARHAFVERFWQADRGYLADVIDAGLVKGAEDWSLRPNQIFAVGGLPKALVPNRIGKKVLEAVARHLYTPRGLRTLSPSDPAYRGRYSGGPSERDSAYHQGTAWPWLLGPFGEAWLRIHGDGPGSVERVRSMCLAPLRTSLEIFGLGHLFEIADGDSPHTPGGCPFQAWSLGEYLRLEQLCSGG